MRALLIYYSFTDQARIATDLVAASFRDLGYEVDTVRIDFADPVERLSRPASMTTLRKWATLSKQGATLPVVLDPPINQGVSYDVVVLFSNTWNSYPAVPIRSFLKSDDAKVLQDKRVAIAVICRGLWERNLEIVTSLVEEQGGSVIVTSHFGSEGGWLSSTIQNVRYMATKGPERAYLGPFKMPKFGLSAASRKQLSDFGALVARQQSE